MLKEQKKELAGAFLMAVGLAGAEAPASAADKPNIVFFMAEDLAQESFALYGGYGARTPVLENMAREGVVFMNAYSSAPVSSAARSSLITGCYAPSYGLSWHRKLIPVALPEEVRLFPYYLRMAGYHTSNAEKTDYNCSMDPEAWDLVKAKTGDWRKRPSAETPFFHCITDVACHEHSLFFPEEDVGKVPSGYDPDSVHLYPIHPDTPLFRYTYARHYDIIEEVDRHLGHVLDLLREDGLLEDTFVFYFGDNGGCLPGSKAYMGEPGLKVPMVVYIPENWAHLSPFGKGMRCEAVVSFLDFAPTLLRLAGAEVPGFMGGHPFMGEGVSKEEVEALDETFCYNDRIGCHYNPVRVVRKGNFKYIRNFYPHQPKLLGGYYRVRQAAFREWYMLHGEGKLTGLQEAWFRPQGAEELYDLSKDPSEAKNLSGDPEYEGILSGMRADLDRKMLAETDLGLIPEAVWLPYSGNLEAFKQERASFYKEYLALASAQRRPFSKARRRIRKALSSGDEVVRFWAAVDCCHFGKDASPLRRRLKLLLDDSSPLVRSTAASWFAVFEGLNPSGVFNAALGLARNDAEVLSILNDAAYVHAVVPDMPLSLNYSGSKNVDINERLKELLPD